MAKSGARGTRQSDLNKRRKGALAVVIPWMRRFGLALAVCTGLVWAGSWFYLSGALARAGDWAQDKVLLATADIGFTVENILVEGRVHTDPTVLLAIVNVQKGDPLFSFDPRTAQDLIAQVGWVESAQIERRLPNTIYVGLKERQPLALWQDDKRIKLLDMHGEVIPAGDLQRFTDLVLVSGAGARQHAADLIANVRAEPDVFERIEAAGRIGDRRWDLVLKNGIRVQLPEEDVGLALRRLAQAHEEGSIMDRDLVAIDMREDDRISIRTNPGHVQEYKASLKIEAKAGNNI